ncbi:hypothetical protein B9G98_01562 [Wickerhamiella sorbophila]|uniref:Ca3427-like PBP 2 domain-containing protein n=1 Tax=Wickerhamiella sorbophila TaxID=45607 RepID=A0A2T0FG18_9ASCO|nr:hypothetical protein B9G98_01562 [Wickerhamiella sorbophila]PRT53942.1 hypothetical protein B9G98_01562 [Wickerhamiella sorbophila]
MKLVVGYVPEHFSTPLFLALQHGFYAKHNVDVEFKPFPSGSGHLIQCLGDKTINVSVGLTEAFIRGIAAGNESYKLVGVYVQSPLCWAVSTGSKRDIRSVDELEGSTVGVSRMGSGSDVMAKVLQLQKGWTTPFKYEINNDFKNLRDGVNHVGAAHPTDFFMWEHFTSKKYYDSGEIKRVGEIYTPWPSWVISASPDVDSGSLKAFVDAVNEGIAYFRSHPDEAISYITSNLDYSEEDARNWLKTVKFSDDCAAISNELVQSTLDILKPAAGLPEGVEKLEYIKK